jgi:hypothetical protein
MSIAISVPPASALARSLDLLVVTSCAILNSPLHVVA